MLQYIKQRLSRSYDKSRFAPQTSARPPPFHLPFKIPYCNFTKKTNSGSDISILRACPEQAAGLESVLKPKTATCLRNQSSPLIDRFNSSIRTVIAPQVADDDLADADEPFEYKNQE